MNDTNASTHVHNLPSSTAKANPNRYSTGPWDEHFGDPPGIPKSAAILLVGPPGSGKTTLAIQILRAVLNLSPRDAHYLSCDMEVGALKTMMRRLGISEQLHPRIRMHRNDLRQASTRSYEPALILVDSVGSLSLREVKELVEKATKMSRRTGAPMIFTTNPDRYGQVPAEAISPFDIVVQLGIHPSGARTLHTLKNRGGRPGTPTTFAFDQKGFSKIR
jgi:predicted ATP-dependent serine protease